MSEAIPPLPQYAFMAWCSVKKHKDNFTFTFTLPVESNPLTAFEVAAFVNAPLLPLTEHQAMKHVSKYNKN
jgi:hypothetical protein